MFENMRNNALYGFFFLMLALAVVPSLRAQSDCDDTYLPAINSALDKGDCEMARRYYDAYVACRGNRIDPTIERRIQECLDSKDFVLNSSQNGDVVNISVGNVTLRMVYVGGGTFTMGCTAEQGNDCWDNEKPAHQVALDDYYIGETEVTQALWREVMGSEPTADGGWTTEYGRGDNFPAYNVSYEDVQEFIERLNRKTGRTFRLPTEAEWEFAVRGGNNSHGYKYSGSNNLDEVGWYHDNCGGRTHAVKRKKANELGLYDMGGNVWEWCQDWYGKYNSGSQRNPKGPSSGSYRVFRGGSWFNSAWDCRVSLRTDSRPSRRNIFLGFRLVLVP